MAGPTSRKHKPQDELSSPTKRLRKGSPSAHGSDSSTTAEEATTASNAVLNNAITSSNTDNTANPVVLNIPDYVPDEVYPRLQRLRSFSEPEFNRYSLLTIPANADWGSGANGRWSHLESLLCHDNKPLVVWMVGVTRWVNLEDSEKLTIGLRLLSDDETVAAARNSTGRCVPEQAPKELGTLTYANKWVDKRDRTPISEFTEVYNAVDGQLRGWNADQKMNAADIRPSDIVVVEFYIRRFKNKALNKGRGWTAWGVNFDLLRIAQLVVGPGLPQELPPASSAVI